MGSWNAEHAAGRITRPLFREIVETIDTLGLKARHLSQHTII
jgi:hypothetical protein